MLKKKLNCTIVENLGNKLAPTIITKINEDISGTEHRISRRKTLVLNEVLNTSFEGCEMTISVDSTLKRKNRHDAHGTFVVRGNISSFNLLRREVCYTNARVTDIKFSHMSRVSERVYKWVANRVLPNNSCFQQNFRYRNYATLIRVNALN